MISKAQSVEECLTRIRFEHPKSPLSEALGYVVVMLSRRSDSRDWAEAHGKLHDLVAQGQRSTAEEK